MVDSMAMGAWCGAANYVAHACAWSHVAHAVYVVAGPAGVRPRQLLCRNR